MKRVLRHEKRIARAEVIFDTDDYFILSNIIPAIGTPEEVIKKILNLSHKSLLIHLKRLASHNLIRMVRSEENYKRKILEITPAGFELINGILGDSPRIRVLVNEKSI